MGQKKREKSPKRYQKAQPVVVKKKKKRAAYGATYGRSKPELKNIDYITNTLFPTSASSNFNVANVINLVAQGATPLQYIGRSLMMKKLSFRYIFNSNTTNLSVATNGSFMVRLLLVYDKDPNGTAPLITEILTTDDFGSFNNLDSADRYCVLYDKIKQINPDGGGAVGGAVNGAIGFWKGNIKLNHIMKFQGATAAITSITKGAIYAFIAQNGDGNFAGLVTQGQWWSRVRFIDE